MYDKDFGNICASIDNIDILYYHLNLETHTKWEAMDELDQKLLNELERRGFQSTTTLAHCFDVGERTIRRRIGNMLSEDIIRVVALPNYPLLGYRAWAKIGIKVEAGHLSSVARRLVEHPRIYFAACALGRFEIIIAVSYKTTDGLMYFLNSELTKVKGIRATEAMMLVHPSKYYNFSWPAPKFKKGKDGGEHYIDVNSATGVYELDEVDSKILSVLQKDGLVRPAGLKSKLGIGESTIRKRIRNMLNNGAFKTVVVPNPEVLGYEAWATMGITVNDQFSRKTMKTLTEHPAVYLASYSIGRFNLIIAARFHSIDLLDRFVNMELPAIAGVGSVETFLHVRPLKYHNINWYPLTSSEALNHQQGGSLGIELDGHSEDLDKPKLKRLKYGQWKQGKEIDSELKLA